MSLEDLPLHTPSQLLRRFVPEDARELFVLSQEEIFRAGLPSQAYRDEAHAGSSVEFLISQYDSPADPRHGACVLAIEHAVDRVLIGHVGFSRLGFSPFDDDVEIGYAIAERYQRRGLATEAIVAACRWAFDTFELDRIIGITFAVNTTSRRAMMRAHFTHLDDRVMMAQGTEQLVSVYSLSARSQESLELLTRLVEPEIPD